jgi:hypothetical protein
MNIRTLGACSLLPRANRQAICRLLREWVAHIYNCGSLLVLFIHYQHPTMQSICLNIPAYTSPKGLTDEAMQSLQEGSDLANISIGPQELFIDPHENGYLIPRILLNSSMVLKDGFLPLLNVFEPLTLDDIDNATFKLYVSWAYTRSYPEDWVKVPNPLAVRSLDGVTEDLACLFIPYEIKAGILAWLLGHRLQDPEFQNYAMHRLMHAVLCQSGPIDTLTIRFVRAQSVRGSKLNLFLERMLFMNWGDEQRVVGGIEDWYTVFGNDAELLQLFLGESRRDLAERQGDEIIWERYMVSVEEHLGMSVEPLVG